MRANLQLGQIVHFVLKPTQQGMITSLEYCLDGGLLYKVNFFEDEGHVISGYFYERELESEE